MTFGEQIRAIRRARGLSSNDVPGMVHSTMTRVERDNGATIPTLQKIAKALDVAIIVYPGKVVVREREARNAQGMP